MRGPEIITVSTVGGIDGDDSFFTYCIDGMMMSSIIILH